MESGCTSFNLGQLRPGKLEINRCIGSLMEEGTNLKGGEHNYCRDVRRTTGSVREGGKSMGALVIEIYYLLVSKGSPALLITPLNFRRAKIACVLCACFQAVEADL